MFKLVRIQEHNLTIRWLIGEHIERPLRSIGYDMLDLSIKFAGTIFPYAKRIIMISNLPLGTARIKNIADKNNVIYENIDQNLIPPVLNNLNFGHGFWKYLPMRRQPAGFDLIMENDFILWRPPTPMIKWFYNGGFLGYTNQVINKGASDTGPIQDSMDRRDNNSNSNRDSYNLRKESGYGKMIKPMINNSNISRPAKPALGIFENKVNQIQPNFALNPGIVGFGFNCSDMSININDISNFISPVDENGWLTFNYLNFAGSKHLIDGSSCPSLDMADVSPQDLFEKFDGAHFVNHNNGISRVFQTKYSKYLEKIYTFYTKLTEVP